MSDWLRRLRELQRTGRDCVRVTIMDVRGSAPREIGATMLVTAEDLAGSIGGGQLEYQCTRLAAETLTGRTSTTPCPDSTSSGRTSVTPCSDSIPPDRATRRLDHSGRNSTDSESWGGPTRRGAGEAAGKASDSGGWGGPTRRAFPLGAAMGQCCGGVVDVLFEVVPAAGADWLDACTAHRRQRTPAVLVTAIDGDGGWSRALVMRDGCAVGEPPAGKVLDAARRMLDGGAAARCLREGNTRILLEAVMDTAFTVAVFGAGHVGSALVSVLTSLDCRIRWIDGRHDVFPDAVPGNVTCIESTGLAREVAAMPAGTFYLVMTHSHALDYEICERILARDDFAYCGLIGSRSKRRRFEKRLRAQGTPESQIERLTCPIGVGGIGGKQPAEIAVAVAAQLLQSRKSARFTGDVAGNVHVLRP